MKKHIFLFWSALIGMGCFTACSHEDGAMMEDSKTPVAIRASIYNDAGARVALDESESGKTKVVWSVNDAFHLRVDELYEFRHIADDMFVSEHCPETFPFTGTVTATYPAVIDFSYASQDGSREKVGDYMKMTAACDVTEGDRVENLRLTFKHHTSVVSLNLTNNDFAGKAVSVSLSATHLLEDGTTIATTNENLKGNLNGMMEVYLAVPATADGKELEDFKITATCEGAMYEAKLTATSLDAGKLYRVTKDMDKVNTSIYKEAADAVKGDYAMKNGKFISGNTPLTDEQKAEMAGIVFWTTADANPTGKTPANLTDDKVMKAEFPNCNHGLIVSLKDLKTEGNNVSIPWQYAPMNMAEWQMTDKFTPENVLLYQFIASGTDSDDLINHILGYQHTKILKALNASSIEMLYHVVFIPLLETFSAANPAPKNTTGWFIPSVKELTLLCGIDTDDVYQNNFGCTTMEKMNTILNALGSDYADELNDSYWSSTENETNDAKAFYLMFDTNPMVLNGGNKISTNRVRAICAF